MHAAAREWVREAIRDIGAGLRVLEAGPRGDPARDLFPGAEYCGVDRLRGDGVTIIADASEWWPAIDRRPDRVACFETLHYVRKPAELLLHLWNVLAPGGWLIVTCAAPERPARSAIDGGPLKECEHWAGVEPHNLRRWLARPEPAYVVVDHDPVVGDVRMVARKPARHERGAAA